MLRDVVGSCEESFYGVAVCRRVLDCPLVSFKIDSTVCAAVRLFGGLAGLSGVLCVHLLLSK